MQSEIKFEWDPCLVRGLDYYSDFCFEYIIKEKEDFSQKAVLAGGRYDTLHEELGGSKSARIRAVGFAMGIDRLMGKVFLLFVLKQNHIFFYWKY